MVASALNDVLAPSDYPSDDVAEADADVTRDGETASTGGTTEYTE